MTDTGEQTVLGRKARAARAAQEARAMSPARAMRLALERCAARDLGFAVSVRGVGITTEMAEGFAADLPDPALILLLDGPGGVPGAAVLDAQMSAALVEVQTMGRVLARPAQPRAPTRTDAAIAQLLIEGMLTRLIDLLEDEGAHLRGYSFGAMIEDGRALALVMGTCAYEVMRVGCDLGADRGGEVILALPCPPEPVDEAPDRAAQGDPAGARPLRDRLLSAPARLDAVLCRMPLPLNQLRGLKPGQVLPLPAGVLTATALEVAPGRVVARAVLGQMSGQRALRLRGVSARPGVPPAPDADGSAPRPRAGAPLSLPAMPSPPAPVARVDPGEGLPEYDDFDLHADGDFGQTGAPPGFDMALIDAEEEG